MRLTIAYSKIKLIMPHTKEKPYQSDQIWQPLRKCVVYYYVSLKSDHVT